LDLACTLQQIPAPTFSESQRASFIVEQFKQIGLEQVFVYQVGNVLAKIPGCEEALPLVISAHMDTVFPLSTDLTLVKEVDKIYGPGIGDNSLGVAALFGVAWEFFSYQAKSGEKVCSELPGDIWLVANVCEEGLGDLLGMRAVVDRFTDQVKTYLVLEGMALGQIYNQALGVHRYKINARTAGGHSWVDFGKPSAIHELSGFVNQLGLLNIPSSPRTTYNVGKISGGTSVNTIASEASLELDLRSEDSQSLMLLINQVQELVTTANQPGVEMTFETIGSRPSGQLSPSHPLIKLAQQVLKAQGFQPNLIIGSTDANIPLSAGYPAICVGITHGAGAHTTGEYIQTRPIAKGVTQVIELVKEIFAEL
jgi:acetylornithine deacetylase/succinyl-diaminopimelate desuccinylase-like protein